MAKSKCSKITIAAALLVLFIATTLQAQTTTKPAADELLRIIPADSLFCVRINNFDYTLSQIDQFLAGVSPVPMGTSMLVRMQLAQLFGSPQLQGINMGGTFAIFGTLAPGEPIQPNQLLSILVPVTDYKQFVSGNLNVGPPDEKGVSKIIGVGAVVIQVGNFALIKPPGSDDKLVKLAKSIKEGRTAGLTTALDAAEAKQATKQPIWIYGNIQQVSKTLGPVIFAKIEGMKTMLDSMKSKRHRRIQKLEQTRNEMAKLTSNRKAHIKNIDQKIEKLKEQQDKSAAIQAQLANMISNRKGDIENIDQKIKILKERQDKSAALQAQIERLEQIMRNMLANSDPNENPAIRSLDQKIDKLRKEKQQPIDPQASKVFGNVINMYAGILETLLKETKSLTIALNPKPSVLNITKIITAIPGTDMAGIFVADTSARKENKLLGYLEDGAMMNFAARMNTPCCKKFYDKVFDLFAPIFGDTLAAEDIAKMKALSADAIDSLAGPIAFSFSTDAKYKSPFAVKYVLEVKDKDKFNRVIQESMQMWDEQAVAGFYKSMGMEVACTIKRGADSYKGVSIDSANLVMKSTDPNSPQGLMITAMYSEGLEYRWAMVDGLCVFAVGGDADSGIRALVDQVKAGGPKQIGSEMKAALALLPNAGKADVMGTFNYVRVLKMLPAMMGAMMPVPMPEVDFPTQSNIVFAANVGNGKLTFDIAIPKQHLAEIMAAVQMMMQHQMQLQTQPVPGQPTMQPNANKSRVTTTKVNLRLLHGAVIQFKMDIGRFPTEEEGLTALVKQPSNVTNYPPRGYLDNKKILKDAWGREFIYKRWPDGRRPFVIVSYGADGKEGGQGDNADLRSTDAF